MSIVLSEQSRQNPAERITWLVLLVLTALFSYKLGARSTVEDSRFLNKKAVMSASQDSRLSSISDPSLSRFF